MLNTAQCLIKQRLLLLDLKMNNTLTLIITRLWKLNTSLCQAELAVFIVLPNDVSQNAIRWHTNFKKYDISQNA